MPRITKKQLQEQKEKEEQIKKWNSFTEEHLLKCINSTHNCITHYDNSINILSRHINEGYNVEESKEYINKYEKEIKKYEEELKTLEDIYIKRFGYKSASLDDPKVKEENNNYLNNRLNKNLVY